MKWLRLGVKEQPGFTFNPADLLIIGSFFFTSYLFKFISPYGYYYLLPLYVGFTFFLFCNVFRIGNRLERYWYVPFVIITILTFNRPDVYWKLIALICEPLKVGLIIYRIKRGNYIGIFHRQLSKN
jgi:hypothetical protein